MTRFASAVTEFWAARFGVGDVIHRDEEFVLVVDPGLADDRRVMVMDVVDGRASAVVTPAVAASLGIDQQPVQTEAAFRDRLRHAGIELHGADHLYYFADAARSEVGTAQPVNQVRLLTAADAKAFAEFESAASASDLDDAYVELDHWAVFGAFVGARLVCAASAYPWQGGRLADIGVLTLPSFRGQGGARAVVRAISQHALGAGYEPQYRCQFDNVASVAVARAAGLTRFGSWEVVSARTAS